MAQISLYMNDATMDVLRTRSRREGKSISKYVAQIVHDHVSGNEDAWPAGYWQNVYGCMGDAEADGLTAALQGGCLDSALDDGCTWFEEA